MIKPTKMAPFSLGADTVSNSREPDWLLSITSTNRPVRQRHYFGFEGKLGGEFFGSGIVLGPE